MAPLKISLGGIGMQQIGRYSNDYTRTLNRNLIRMAMTFNPSVISRVTPLPDTANEGDCYIDPANGSISMWVDTFDDHIPEPPPTPSGFYQVAPSLGIMCFVQDEQKYYVFGNNGWEEALDLNAVHMGVEREIALYAPGNLRPNNAMMFRYVAGLEFTIAAGAPNSGAYLEVAPTSAVTLTIRHNNAQVGTISFAAGSQNGVVSVPAEVIVQPSHLENMYVQAHELTVIGPVNWFDAKGLSFTLRGKIRPID